MANTTSNLGLPLDVAGHAGPQQAIEQGFKILDEKVNQPAEIAIEADAASDLAAGDLQATLIALSARVKALEP